MDIFQQLLHKDRGRAAYQGRTGSTKLGLNVVNVDIANGFGRYSEPFFWHYGSFDTLWKNSGSE